MRAAASIRAPPFRPVKRDTCDRLTGRQFGEGTRKLQGNRKGRMGREHQAKNTAAKFFAKFVETASCLLLDQRRDCVFVCRWCRLTQIVRKSIGAIDERFHRESLH
jgi:hypothetical protein